MNSQPGASPDFRSFFESAPGLYLVVRPDLTVEAASDAYLRATRTDRAGIVGKSLLDTFPANPDDPARAGVAALRASIERAIAGRAPDRMPSRQYDPLRPASDARGPCVRHWSPLHTPVFDAAGGLTHVIHELEDVTDREEAQDRAEAILESITDAFYAIGRDWRFTYLNREAERILGRPRADLIGRHIWEEFAPAIKTDFYDAYRRAMDEGVSVPFEVYYPPHDCWYDVRAYPSPAGISVYFRDINDRKRVQEELRRSEQRLRFLARLDALTQPLTDPAEITAAAAQLLGEHLDVNRCAYAEVDEDEDQFELTGDYNRGVPSIVGRYAFADFGQEVLRLMRANEPYVMPDVESDPRAGDDLAAYRLTLIRAVICVPLHKGGRFVAAMAVHQQVPRRWTPDEVELVQLVAARCWESIERARVARSLRQSDERFRAIVSQVTAGVAEADLQGRFVLTNRRYCELTGYSAEELAGMRLFDITHPDDVERTRENFQRLVDEGVDFQIEKRYIRKDGEEVWSHNSVSPVLDASGRTGSVVAVCLDVTDRKRTEEETNRLYAELRENDRRKDEFLAMLAHELRNPLAAVRNAVGVMRMSEEREDLDFARGVIDRQVWQLTRLIDDLLDVSRINSGKIRLRKEFADAGQILNRAIESARPLIDERKHELTTDFAVGRLPLRADAARIEQIALNLLTNAAKYTESGGHIRLSARREGGEIVISVADDGIGIPPEKLPEMFVLFAQGERSIARSEGGLGLGLTIVQRLAEMHGGGVSAASGGVGKGSTFTVRLPAADDAPAVAPGAGPAAGDAGRRSRILVVDDSADTAGGLSRLLTHLGHDVKVAFEGHSALEIAREFRPEFVLLDIGLPGMDGYDLAPRLRSASHCGDSVIIAVSGYGQAEDRRKSRAAGIDHHLVKPIEFDALCALLNRAP